MLGVEFLMLLGLYLSVRSLPIGVEPPQENLDPEQKSEQHYRHYLMEVERVLKEDPHFRDTLKNSTIEDFMKGSLTKELKFVHHKVRSKLDELKREELKRVRTLLKAKHAIAEEKGHSVDHQGVLKQFAYLNHMNQEKFEVEDLDRLITELNKHVEQLDQSRRQEVKRYHMMQEHERREHVRSLSEEQRREEEQRHQAVKLKRANHRKINHPGSEDQLKEVWQETDGLDPDDFEPKTFFKLHDNNGDGFLDQAELEALFNKELEKAYEEDSSLELEEERARMRNHVIAEVDTNKDRLVSLSEFMDIVNSDKFSENEEWETADQNPDFTEEELKEFEQNLIVEKSAISRKAEELQKEKAALQQEEEVAQQRQQLQQFQAAEEMKNVGGQSVDPQVTDA